MATAFLHKLKSIEAEHMPSAFEEVPGLLAKNAYLTHPWSDRIAIEDSEYRLFALFKWAIKSLLYIAEDVRFWWYCADITKEIVDQVEHDAPRCKLFIDKERVVQDVFNRVHPHFSSQREALKVMTLLHQGVTAEITEKLSTTYNGPLIEGRYELTCSRSEYSLDTKSKEVKVDLKWTIQEGSTVYRVIDSKLNFDLITEKAYFFWHAS